MDAASILILIGMVLGIVAGLALLILVPARKLRQQLNKNRQALENFNELSDEDRQVALFRIQLDDYERSGRGF